MNTAEYVLIMIKGLGAAFLTYFCSSVCRESGQGGVADIVELAGRLEILLLCLPLFIKLIETSSALLSL